MQNLPEIVLIHRDTWTDTSGKPHTRDAFEIRGGDVDQEWADSIRVPAAAWCSVSIWNDETRLASWGGEVWPSAWPQLFELVGPRGRQIQAMTPVAVGLFAAARGAT